MEKMRTKEKILEDMKMYADNRDLFLLEVLADIRDLLIESVYPKYKVTPEGRIEKIKGEQNAKEKR